jgi:diguanylate cyclase (GGDEF)-like protein
LPVRLPLPEQRQHITCLFEDSQGRVWIGTKNDGAFMMPSGTGDALPVSKSLAVSVQDGIETIVEGGAGEIWIGTYSRGILIVDGTTFASRRIRHDPFVPGGLDDDLPWAMYRDAAGAVWVGTSRGLIRHNPYQGAVLTLFGAAGRPKGISDPDIGAVLPLEDGRLWLGLGVNGVDIVDPVLGRVGGFHPSSTDVGKNRSPTEILSFLRIPSGDIYIFARNGLFRKRPSRTGLERLPPTSARMRTGIQQPGSNRLWLGSNNGLWTLNPNVRGASSIERYPASSALSDHRVSVMERGPEAILWVGTQNGLNRVDTARGTVEQIMAVPNSPVGIGAPWVGALAIDRRGRLWVGTVGGGISILEKRDGKGHYRFRQIGTADGLPDMTINKLLVAPTGEIWASTDSGLAFIEPSNFKVRSLRQAEGVAIPSYWGNSGAVTTNGELAFGGVGGLTIVRPDRLTRDVPRLPVVVTDVHIGGKSVPWAGFNDGDTPSPIIIFPDANSLSVEFSLLNYSAPERNRYAYRLEGRDPDWIDTDWAHRVATYTNLPPGRYVLHLRASKGDGTWNEKSLSLPIQVRPAWYQTAWFRAVEVFVVLGIVFAIVQIRTSYLRQRQRHLEHVVADRTAELRGRERELEKMAYSDLLTALPNRRMFAETFNRLCEGGRRQGTRFVLLLVDLDRFKQINDTLGHDAGDAMLVEAAKRLQAAVLQSDIVFRLGGDEFAILLEVSSNLDRTMVEVTCSRIVDSFAETIQFNNFDMKTSPSIGVASFPDHGTTEASLYKAADLALYAAKQAGRNTWHWRVETAA